MHSVIIDEARMEGSTAYVTVRFVSEQVNVTRDASGRPVEGSATDEEAPRSIVDLWTFARNLRSKDPTWLLVATRAEDTVEEDGPAPGRRAD